MKLEWKQANIREPITYRAGVSGAPTPQDWEAVASQMWDFFVREITPLNEPETWQVVRCEFWMDSGRLITFVAKENFDRRIDKGTCELVISEFAQLWQQLATTHAASDAAFVGALMKAQRRYARIFVLALKHAVAAIPSHPLKGREVQFWNADAEHILTEKI